MIEIVRGRRQGKTSDLIRLSSESGIPIVVPNYQRRNHIVKSAHCLGYQIPEPIVYTVNHYGKRTDILVDDIDMCDGITQYVSRIGSEIQGYTISVEEIYGLRKLCDDRGMVIKELSKKIDELTKEIKRLKGETNESI